MLLIKNIFLQQTSPTFFIVSILAVLVFFVIIFIVGSSEEKNENKGIEIEKSRQKLWEKRLEEKRISDNKNEESKRQGEQQQPLKKTTFTTLSDKNDKFENLIIIIDYFMNNHKDGGYLLEDEYSGKWVQFAYLGSNYVAETSIRDEKGNLIEDYEIVSNARKIFGDCEIDEGLFSENITDKPIEGALFLVRTFFEVFQLNNVKLSFKTFEYLKFKNSQYNLENLIFDFDRLQYLNLMEKRFPNIQSTLFENGKLKEPKNYNLSNSKTTPIKKKENRRISQITKDKVWRRDEGKCVECGSNEKLEFDHIIPFSKGGSNTYRNIQLLCEPCNRSKSDKIG